MKNKEHFKELNNEFYLNDVYLKSRYKLIDLNKRNEKNGFEIGSHWEINSNYPILDDDIKYNQRIEHYETIYNINKTKENKIKNQNENKNKINISLYFKKLKPSFKFPMKRNLNRNDVNKKTSKINNKTFELNKIKEILNKTIRKRNIITTNDFNTISVSTISNKTLLFTETERKKISTPKRIIKTNRNINKYEINNSFYQLKTTSHSEKRKRIKKCINIIY